MAGMSGASPLAGIREAPDLILWQVGTNVAQAPGIAPPQGPAPTQDCAGRRGSHRSAIRAKGASDAGD
jgi:hypothetical protein